MKKFLTVAMAFCLTLSAVTMAACNGNKNESKGPIPSAISTDQYSDRG